MQTDLLMPLGTWYNAGFSLPVYGQCLKKVDLKIKFNFRLLEVRKWYKYTEAVLSHFYKLPLMHLSHNLNRNDHQP